MLLTPNLLQTINAQVVHIHPHAPNNEVMVALALVLHERNIPYSLRIGFCTEVVENDVDITNLVSPYVVIQVLDTTWDIKGPDAKERWEARWFDTADTRYRITWKIVKKGNDIVSINEILKGVGHYLCENQIQQSQTSYIVLIPKHVRVEVETPDSENGFA